MKFVPHDYQTYAIDYIKSHRIAALFWTVVWERRRLRCQQSMT